MRTVKEAEAKGDTNSSLPNHVVQNTAVGKRGLLRSGADLRMFGGDPLEGVLHHIRTAGFRRIHGVEDACLNEEPHTGRVSIIADMAS